MQDNDLWGNFPNNDQIHVWWRADFQCGGGPHTQETFDEFDFYLGQTSVYSEPEIDTHARTWTCGDLHYDSAKADYSHDDLRDTNRNS